MDGFLKLLTQLEEIALNGFLFIEHAIRLAHKFLFTSFSTTTLNVCATLANLPTKSLFKCNFPDTQH